MKQSDRARATLARRTKRATSRWRSGFGLLFLLVFPGAGRAQEGAVRWIQNIFEPTSTSSHLLYDISILTIAICAGIFLIVGGLLTYAVFRYRRRGPEDDVEEPPQVYGSAAIELAWTVPPILIVVVLVLVTARTIGEIRGPRDSANEEQVQIIGHRFWWEVRYPRYHVTAANEIHVPVSDRVIHTVTEFALESADVVHGFWVPQLAGKSWLVPNQRNDLWMEPFQTGIYPGNCTVLCGAQHANMLIRVVVDSRDDYIRWLNQQQKPAVSNPEVETGRKQFVNNTCGTCHRIDGIGANGVFGPDLTHFAGRQTLGSGVAVNNDENLRSWLKDPQVLKPGCLMPNMKLDDQQIEQIMGYLKTLK